MPVAFRKLEVDIRSCVFLAGRRHMDKGGIAMPKSVSQRKNCSHCGICLRSAPMKSMD